MYGQMTAGSWIYIGSQGIVQGTYETFGAVARQHFNGQAKGKWVLTGGLGGMGGAQPLPATMAGFAMIAVECDEAALIFACARATWIKKLTPWMRHLAYCTPRWNGATISIGLLGNAADVFSELVARHITPDVVTDQTSAHDPQMVIYRNSGPWHRPLRCAKKMKRGGHTAKQSMAVQVQAMLGAIRGAATLDYGNNIRQMALEAGVDNAFDFQDLYLLIFAPCFAGALARSAGWHSRAIPTTFIKPMLR